MDCLSTFRPIPPELLLPIIENSDWPLRTYLQFLSLSHPIRETVHGALREITFEHPAALRDETKYAPTPTADSLAAIVGPCKKLRKMSFPQNALGECQAFVLQCPPWVNEAFAGHTNLTALYVPTLEAITSVMGHILGHLSGLEELHLSPDPSRPRTELRWLMEVLNRRCPRLRVLDLPGLDLPTEDRGDIASLGRSLRQVDMPNATQSEYAEALLRRCTSLERLTLTWCPGPSMESFAARLTHLSLLGFYDMDGLPDLGCCRLEFLALSGISDPAALRMLTANQATLHSVALQLSGYDQGPLWACLIDLPRLTTLDLQLADRAVSLNALPPSLANRLTSLSLRGPAPSLDCGECPVRFSSATLRRLELGVNETVASQVTLACPALEVLSMPQKEPCPLVLECPRLLSLLDLCTPDLRHGAMPALVRLTSRQVPQPGWLPGLMRTSPRLSQLSLLGKLGPEALGAILAAGVGLTRLTVHLDGAQCHPALLELVLPAALERLEVGLSLGPTDFQQLRVVASPGLRTFRLCGGPGFTQVIPVPMRVALRAPGLASLQLDKLPTLSAVEFEGPAPPPPLTSLIIGDCYALEGAALLRCLTEYGARLRWVGLPRLSDSCVAVWRPLLAALCGLPQLQRLEFDSLPPCEMLTLACPTLRYLQLPTLPGSFTRTHLRSLVLDCPRLEVLQAPLGRLLESFQLTQPASPFLRLVVGVSADYGVLEMVRDELPPGVVVPTPDDG
ncbi:hypothetical protein PAPYR_2931 [Paratrimastix pyriformis]|uniref:Uncharacterized protein n=1 Tax=Paratrimastix pyriformis TaxID=342808 RepID=A0ABQ8UPF3_9EUKA|nr:hypothetical protein PAPYR_2931 [Paratrimastix pyriformis]